MICHSNGNGFRATLDFNKRENEFTEVSTASKRLDKKNEVAIYSFVKGFEGIIYKNIDGKKWIYFQTQNGAEKGRPVNLTKSNQSKI